MDDIDLKIAHRYALFNCTEIDPILKSFTDRARFIHSGMAPDDLDVWLEDNFPIFFKHVARTGQLDMLPNSSILKDMAEGPLRNATRYNICYVNGYKFHASSHGTRKAADNSGVCVKQAANSIDADDFYGRLDDIIEIEYPAMPIKRVTLFKCHWYDHSREGRGHGKRVHDKYQLVDVHIHRSYKKYDPFILASQAQQVFYMPYPSTRSTNKDWRAVCKVRPKKYQVSVNTGGANEDIAFQEDCIPQFNLVDSTVYTHGCLVDAESSRYIICDSVPRPALGEEPIADESTDEDLVLSDNQVQDSEDEDEEEEEEEEEEHDDD